jgi:hypothetical protein
MIESFEDNLTRCLKSAAPVPEMRALVEECLKQGINHSELLQKLDSVRQQLRQADREADEEAVMDVMDMLVGWCGPHMSLAPKQ